MVKGYRISKGETRCFILGSLDKPSHRMSHQTNCISEMLHPQCDVTCGLPPPFFLSPFSFWHWMALASGSARSRGHGESWKMARQGWWVEKVSSHLTCLPVKPTGYRALAFLRAGPGRIHQLVLCKQIFGDGTQQLQQSSAHNHVHSMWWRHVDSDGEQLLLLIRLWTLNPQTCFALWFWGTLSPPPADVIE